MVRLFCLIVDPHPGRDYPEAKNTKEATMALFEVTYEINEEMASMKLEAESPVEAARIFTENHAEPGAVVLCVVRQ